MKEILLTKCKSLTLGNYNKCTNSERRKYAKLALHVRFCIFIGLILIFYTAFLLTASGDSQEDNSTVGEVLYSQPSQQRQLRSLVAVSSFDFEDFAGTSQNYNAHTQHQKNVQQTYNYINLTNSTNCTQPAILLFPADGFTRAQRQNGWIIIHIFVALYSFWILAVICDDYFLPAIEQLCLALNMQTDVMGATFMAAATSSPGLFMNCVGTFVTKGDIGFGTIVGSSVFNILAVPACCGLFIGQCVRLHWWPVTRDCMMYCLAVVALIFALYDGKVMWYESLILFIGYFFYMAVMYNNDKVALSARQLISKYRRKLHLVRSYRQVTQLTPLMGRILYYSNGSLNNRNYSTLSLNGSANGDVGPTRLVAYVNKAFNDVEKNGSRMAFDAITLNTESSAEIVDDFSDYADSPWQRADRSLLQFIVRWPITFLLYITVPDSRKHPRAKYITFLLSICWIGAISYLVAYTITIIGDTISIPDSVMGLTILSAGMSVPEAVSSIIVTSQGHGAMGISNAIGSNTFDILLCLSVPWFIKAYFLPDNPQELWVSPNSSGLTYSVIFLLTALMGLYFTLAANRFILNRRIGIICLVMYCVFMTFALMIELNVFFPVNLPVCAH